MSSPIEIARAAWKPLTPDWIERLAEECAAGTQRSVAEKLGRSAGLISQVLRNKYPGDMASIEEAVRGAFMDAMIVCPALGNLPTDECQSWRRNSRHFVNTNSLRVRMYRACQNCPVNKEAPK